MAKSKPIVRVIRRDDGTYFKAACFAVNDIRFVATPEEAARYSMSKPNDNIVIYVLDELMLALPSSKFVVETYQIETNFTRI